MLEFLGKPLPAEIHATCHDCAMAPPNSGACGCDVVFRPELKCCTFMPDIPNFLAGAVLADESPEAAEGRALFDRNAEARAFVTPLGAFPPEHYSVLYKFNAGNFFGRSESLKCPYFIMEGGLCGIWRHRNGRCSTWFCRHERGAVGKNLWLRVDKLLSAVESSLAKWCLLQLDIGPDAMAAWIPPSGDPVPGTRGAWGEWAGKERELFRACWRLVEPLNWKQVMQITGPEIHVLARLAAEAFRQRQIHQIPARLRCGHINVEPMDGGISRVWAYSLMDSLDLNSTLVSCLSMFNGNPTGETLMRLELEHGIRLEPDLLQKLCDFGILVDES